MPEGLVGFNGGVEIPETVVGMRFRKATSSNFG